MGNENKEEQLDAERAKASEEIVAAEKEQEKRGFFSRLFKRSPQVEAQKMTEDEMKDNTDVVKKAQQGTRYGRPKIKEEVMNEANHQHLGWFRQGESVVHLVSQVGNEKEAEKEAKAAAKEDGNFAAEGLKGKEKRAAYQEAYKETYNDTYNEALQDQLTDNIDFTYHFVKNAHNEYIADKYVEITLNEHKDPVRQEQVVMHEYQHMKNAAKGIYLPSADNTWLGCEAFAKINAADEIGARYAEVSHIRDEYIKAGGGERGLSAVEKFATKNDRLANDYVNLLREGKVDPMLKDQGKQAEELMLISGIVQKEWNTVEPLYIRQLNGFGLNAAQDYNIENIRTNDEETKKRCSAAMTVEMNMGGKKVPVNFMEVSGMDEVLLPPEVQRDMHIVDQNPSLIQEYIKLGSEKFDERTREMEQCVAQLSDELSNLNAKRFGDDKVMPELRAQNTQHEQKTVENRAGFNIDLYNQINQRRQCIGK